MRSETNQFKYFIFMCMLYNSVLQVSVLLDYKFISIGKFFASSATFVISLTFFISDIIAEVYGYQNAKKVILSGVACLIFFSSVGYFLQKLQTPSGYEQYAKAYDFILNLLFRAGFSNAIAILIGAFFNVYFVNKWRIILRGKHFWLRSLCASAIGEALYTVFVVSLLNFGILDFGHLCEVLLISYTYKLLFDILAIIPANLLANFLKDKESIETLTRTQNIMPFRIA